MVVSADTSFLFALYGNDVHTPRALAWAQSATTAISISELTDFELGNALRFAEFRRVLAPGRAATFLAQYEADQAGGRIALEICDLARVLVEAKRLSASYTLAEGHRGFDILHVASALVLGADEFLTFDANQKKLAESEGLAAPV